MNLNVSRYMNLNVSRLPSNRNLIVLVHTAVHHLTEISFKQPTDHPLSPPVEFATRAIWNNITFFPNTSLFGQYSSFDQ